MVIAFAANSLLSATKPSIVSRTFTTALPSHHDAPIPILPCRVLHAVLTRPGGIDAATGSSIYRSTISKAEKYMAKSVCQQYLAKANASGVFGVQCTEGSVRDAAEVARVRSLGMDFRMRNKSAFKRAADMYENRKNAIINAHECNHEESQFAQYPSVAATYNIAQSEASGSCFRYASPETVEEAALLRYMDIQTKIAANPTGVYNVWCNEGTVKDQAEDIRIAALNTAFRQGQKPLVKLLAEKYEQRKQGYVMAHGCSYEESLVSKFPSLGACFRSKSYGF